MVDVATFRTEKKMIDLHQALSYAIQSAPHVLAGKMRNPINWLYPYTEFQVDFSREYKVFMALVSKIRSFTADYVRARIKGENKSDLGEQSDILSLLLETPEVFTEEDCVDEMIGFFFAASETTQNATQTILNFLGKNRSYL